MALKVRGFVQQLRSFISETISYSQFVSHTNVTSQSSTGTSPQKENISSPQARVPQGIINVPHNVARIKGHSVRPYTVIIEGNIGSGKTTFLRPFGLSSRSGQTSIDDLVEVAKGELLDGLRHRSYQVC